MKLNTATKHRIHTHEGAPAKAINAELQLERSIMANMLWENQFYESGQAIADRISDLCKQVSPEFISSMAVKARHKMYLRHVPLLLVKELANLCNANTGSVWRMKAQLIRRTLASVINRPDELSEFLAIYWKDGKVPLSNQIKRGLSDAFNKFDEYQIAKYNRKSDITLKDVLTLCHAKPKDLAQSGIFERLLNDNLATPKTWEVGLSGAKAHGVSKKDVWEDLLRENKMGGMAVLRNLRNFDRDGVDRNLVREAIVKMKPYRILPFRFIAAEKYGPNYSDVIEAKMLECTENMTKLTGRTILLVDVSGSMFSPISQRSDINRMKAAEGLAILLREICTEIQIISFSYHPVNVPNRRGFALGEAITRSQDNGGTNFGEAVSQAYNIPHDRLIAITDEQSHDRVPDPKHGIPSYVINVASYQNGVGYGPWTHIDGWSENVVRYIQSLEGLDAHSKNDM